MCACVCDDDRAAQNKKIRDRHRDDEAEFVRFAHPQVREPREVEAQLGRLEPLSPQTSSLPPYRARAYVS